MAEQWFLDLDGVRSGPYQTPEVLALIAEGEILPHHRISTSLKDQPWTTILEWRLEQAKLSHPSRPPSVIPMDSPNSNKPQDLVPPKKSYDIPWNEPKTPPATTPIVPSNEVSEVELSTDAPADEIEEVIQTLRENPPVETPLESPKLEPVTPAASAPPAAPEVPVETPKTEAPATPKRKRDPMAEMFDLLQNSRQKREAKEKASHQGHPHEHPSSTSSGGDQGWGKTALIGLLIAVAGYFLGQLFQQSSTPPPVATTEKNITAPAKPVETKTEVIDRSTEKLTIKAKIEKPVATPTPRITPKPQAVPQLSEKENQELKDLKKELQELKALKEELRNNPRNSGSHDAPEVSIEEDYPASDETEGGGAAYDTNGVAIPPYDKQGYPPGYPANPYAPQPTQAPHY